MKNLLAFLPYLFSVVLSAQSVGKCKLVVDEFTKNRLVESKLMNIASEGKVFGLTGKHDLHVQYYTFNGHKNIILRAEFYVITTIEKGDKIYIKFEDDSILEIKAQERDVADYYVYNAYKTIWTNHINITLTNTEYNELATKPIKRIRVSESDFDTNKRTKSLVMQMIDCVCSAKQ